MTDLRMEQHFRRIALAQTRRSHGPEPFHVKEDLLEEGWVYSLELAPSPELFTKKPKDKSIAYRTLPYKFHVSASRPAHDDSHDHTPVADELFTWEERLAVLAALTKRTGIQAGLYIGYGLDYEELSRRMVMGLMLTIQGKSFMGMFSIKQRSNCRTGALMEYALLLWVRWSRAVLAPVLFYTTDAVMGDVDRLVEHAMGQANAQVIARRDNIDFNSFGPYSELRLLTRHFDVQKGRAIYVSPPTSIYQNDPLIVARQDTIVLSVADFEYYVEAAPEPKRKTRALNL